MKDSVKVNEAYRAWQACWTLERLIVTGGPTTCRFGSAKAEALRWEEFSERMEQDIQLTQKKFWHTIW